jgi:hypothetical protein
VNRRQVENGLNVRAKAIYYVVELVPHTIWHSGARKCALGQLVLGQLKHEFKSVYGVPCHEVLKVMVSHKLAAASSSLLECNSEHLFSRSC